jgi:hypothetical protein
VAWWLTHWIACRIDSNAVRGKPLFLFSQCWLGLGILQNQTNYDLYIKLNV